MSNREQIIEEGIVIKTESGFAEVDLNSSEDCEDCHAKIFCKPSSERDSSKILKVKDPFGAKIGDKVRISVGGGAVLKASFMLYAIPLILLILGIFLGMEVFAESKLKELLAFILGFGMMAIYFVLVYVIGLNKKSDSENLPRIITISKV